MLFYPSSSRSRSRGRRGPADASRWVAGGGGGGGQCGSLEPVRSAEWLEVVQPCEAAVRRRAHAAAMEQLRRWPTTSSGRDNARRKGAGGGVGLADAW